MCNTVLRYDILLCNVQFDTIACRVMCYAVIKHHFALCTV